MSGGLTSRSAAFAPAARAPKRSRVRRFAVFLFVLPAAAMFIAFIAYPILWVVDESLLRQRQTGAEGFVGLANYADVLRDPVFWLTVRNMACGR